IDFKDEIPYFFKTSTKSALSHDLFASAFYLLTRYEEYLPSIKDSLGRFQSKNSLAFQNGFLKMPVVDLWAKEILHKIQEKYPDIKAHQQPFSFVNTISVHEVFKYAQRGILGTILGLVQDFFKFKLYAIKERIQVILSLKKDPYNTFRFLLDVHKQNQLKSIFFFSIGSLSEYDNNISVERAYYRELIKSIEDYSFIGTLFSMRSTAQNSLKKEEKKIMEMISHRTPNRSRQHLLKLDLPFTYRDLIKIDIKKDFSMGYYDEIGFRASTCSPFLFYDLKHETLTLLKVFPSIFNDHALKRKYGHNRKKIKQEILSLIMTVKEFNGVFVSTFHNDTFSNESQWKGWKEIYLDFIDTINTTQNQK
ncbi:MAG: polysaccharide deacetylase family protein, partial [Flavobacteriales bacterium]